jgi:hypothetical protein
MQENKHDTNAPNMPDKAADFLEDVEKSGIITTGKNFLRSIGALLHGEKPTEKTEQGSGD